MFSKFWKGKECKSIDFECLDLKFGILWLFWWVWCLMEVWEREHQKMKIEVFLTLSKNDGLILFISVPRLCGHPTKHLMWQKKLTFWTYLTNGTNIEGVFGSFHWFKDVPDSEVHFQRLKRGFTRDQNLLLLTIWIELEKG